jgi:hypothetical protein
MNDRKTKTGPKVARRHDRSPIGLALAGGGQALRPRLERPERSAGLESGGFSFASLSRSDL